MAFQNKNVVMAAFFTVLLSIIPSTSAQANHRRQMSPTRTDPNNIPIGIRKAWCEENMQACSILCSNNDTDGQPYDRTASMNSCSPPTLQYNCQCSDGSWPPLRDYVNSIPARICEHSYMLCAINSPYKMQNGMRVLYKDETGNSRVLEEPAVAEEKLRYCSDNIGVYCAQQQVPGMSWKLEGWFEYEEIYGEDFDGHPSVEEGLSSEESMDPVVTTPVDEPTVERRPCATPLKINRGVCKQVCKIIFVLGTSLCIGSMAWMWAVFERARRELKKKQQMLEEGLIREKASEKEVGSDMEKEVFL